MSSRDGEEVILEIFKKWNVRAEDREEPKMAPKLPAKLLCACGTNT